MKLKVVFNFNPFPSHQMVVESIIFFLPKIHPKWQKLLIYLSYCDLGWLCNPKLVRGKN